MVASMTSNYRFVRYLGFGPLCKEVGVLVVPFL